MKKSLKFAQIPFQLVCRFGELGKNEIIVFCVLLGYRNLRTGQCNPKQMNIAQETKIYKTRISEALSGLVRKGWIKISEEGQFLFPVLAQKVTESVTYFDPKMIETEVTKSVTFEERKMVDGVTESVTFEEKEAGDRVTESVTSKAEETMGQVTESVTPSYEIRNSLYKEEHTKNIQKEQRREQRVDFS